MGADVKHVIVTELRRPEDIFYAKIVLELNDKEIEIDSRPSDAIALAVRAEVPIFISEQVMDAASVRPEDDVEDIMLEEATETGEDNRLNIFKDFVDTLDIDALDEDN